MLGPVVKMDTLEEIPQKRSNHRKIKTGRREGVSIVNSFPTMFKKGTEIGTCAPVATIARCVNTVKIDDTLKGFNQGLCKNLPASEKGQARRLICRYQDVFTSEKTCRPKQYHIK
uniref:Uncharacterized protein n=1 Tax=Photinus pyralis TaxID=7054 RepID=A0A1Y1KPE4_PHOPY